MSILKKLMHKSHYRGTKEGDFILSAFAKNELPKCSDDEITVYENFLEYTDNEIKEWLTDPETAPSNLKNIIFKIRNFHNFDC
jgi:succinate dehydrogenase flavin-adding protein (antitoxin of CptAB toxin-antitoxin module)